MVSDPTEPLAPPSSDEIVIKVAFPYPKAEKAHSLPVVTPPIVKIDYNEIGLPTPKKTIPIKRQAPQTRLVRLHLDEPESAVVPPESTRTPMKKPAYEDTPITDGNIADAVQKLLKNVGTIGEAAQESQRQYASIAHSLDKQSAALLKLDSVQRQLDQSHKVETANQRLFDVMHSELKGYKDNFLFDALQKPVIRDLVAVFDDLCGQARHVARFLNENPEDQSTQKWKTELQSSHNNLNNTVFYIIEVLNRLDVTMLESDETMLDLKVHKVVGVEPALTPMEKNQIVRVVRPGFNWKDRILRPTEVIIKKYNAAASDEETAN